MKVRVPKKLRPPAREFDAMMVIPGRYRAILFRPPKNGEMYWSSARCVVMAHCEDYKLPRVILERVK